jgi:hypothetical protein
MKLNINFSHIILILSIFFCSCGRIYLKSIGVKSPSEVNQLQQTSFSKKMNFNEEIIFELDSVKYNQLIKRKHNDSTSWWVQNHVQPVQVIYFDNETNKSIASYFNCIAGSSNFFNFSWNENGELNYFPPLTYTDTRWIDTIFSKSEIENCLIQIPNQGSRKITYPKKYDIFLFYSFAIEKQSVNLINEVNTHINRFIPNQYNLFFINMDNYLFYATRTK